jgi:hypothetical protein
MGTLFPAEETGLVGASGVDRRLTADRPRRTGTADERDGGLWRPAGSSRLGRRDERAGPDTPDVREAEDAIERLARCRAGRSSVRGTEPRQPPRTTELGDREEARERLLDALAALDRARGPT